MDILCLDLKGLDHCARTARQRRDYSDAKLNPACGCAYSRGLSTQDTKGDAMQIVMDIAAWQRGLAGGLLIGAAAATLLAANGRIAGISGVLGGLLSAQPSGGRRWRLLFVLGLFVGGLVTARLAGLQHTPVAGSLAVTLIAGLLVGFGTRMGNGCTSGHGVCGIARFSRRSIIATLTFMGAGFATVFVLRLLGALS
jgi:uncharacterized membrane protein YedE/YeeE